jgi:hypothetical protein
VSKSDTFTLAEYMREMDRYFLAILALALGMATGSRHDGAAVMLAVFVLIYHLVAGFIWRRWWDASSDAAPPWARIPPVPHGYECPECRAQFLHTIRCPERP